MGENMGPIWGRPDPGGTHIGPMNFAIWDGSRIEVISYTTGSVSEKTNQGRMKHNDICQ